MILWHFAEILCKTVDVQVQEIESELNSRKQEEAKRRRDVHEITDQVTALQLELSNLDETVDYQVTIISVPDLYNKRRYVCLSVCLYLCSVWPAKRLGRSRPNLTHVLMSTQGVFLARSMSRSFTYACGSDRITKHPESDTWRTLLKLRTEDGGGDTWRMITKLRPDDGYLQLE